MEGELQRVLGINLRAIRKERGLSQEALAEELGIHRTYASSIERGERNLSLQSVEWLAEVLGVEPLALLTAAPQARHPPRQR